LITSLPHYKLGDIADIIGGGTPSKNIKEYYNGSILWASVRDMKNETLDDTEFKITEKALEESSSKIIPKDNIIIATRVGLGKVCMLAKDTAINQDLKGIIPKDKKVISKYLFYWFKSISKILEENGTGATVKGVQVKFISNLQIPLPPLEEQRRIVGKLDGLFAKIDKSIALLDESIVSASALMPSALNEVFEELGEKWEKKKLDSLVNIVGGGTPSKSNQAYYVNGLIKWATVRDMNTEIIKDTELKITEQALKESSAKIISRDSIVIATRVGLGKVCYLADNIAINQDLKGITPKNYQILDVRYLFNFFNPLVMRRALRLRAPISLR